ncbi:MAG: CHAD domain-containing protein [Actinomycetota bacterium]|nr:CHAD domain-containing protein [Actinomycetota bacterium]
MPYRLSFAEEPAAGLRRCAREQLEEAIEQLARRRADDPVNAVHDARKCLKKTRAVLRLAKPELDKRSYRRENRALRDVARALSAVRDAGVLVETIDDLERRFPGQVPAGTFSTPRRGLEAQVRASRLGDPTVAQLVDDLRDALGRVEDWPLDGASWDTLGRGAVRSFRGARKAAVLVVDDATTENLHEWRKRVKDHWYHQQLLAEAWPTLMVAQAKAAHALADALGNHHDLTLLARRLTDDGPLSSGGVDDDELLGLTARRQAELAETATRIGQRLFAEAPKAYRRRVTRYLRAAALEQQIATPL